MADAVKRTNTRTLARTLSCVIVETDIPQHPTFLAPDIGVMLGRRTRLVETDIPCPYCEIPMQEALGAEAPSRIVRVLKRTKTMARVLAHLIPSTHRTVACYPCKASFTVPKQLDAMLKERAK